MSTKIPDEVQVIEPPRPGRRRRYTAQEPAARTHAERAEHRGHPQEQQPEQEPGEQQAAAGAAVRFQSSRRSSGLIVPGGGTKSLIVRRQTCRRTVHRFAAPSYTARSGTERERTPNRAGEGASHGIGKSEGGGRR